MSEDHASLILLDIVHQIMSEADPYELRVWALQPKDQACISAHFGLGTWIRNELIHLNTPSIAQLRSVISIIHDDDIWTLVLSVLWHVLNGEPWTSISASFTTYTGHQKLCWDE